MSDLGTSDETPRRTVKVYDRPASPLARFMPIVIILVLLIVAFLLARFVFRLF